MSNDVPESMVERVSAAIEAELFRVQELATARGIITPERVARAAIAAMRAPTSHMHAAGTIAAADKHFPVFESTACWQAMIDAALTEDSSPSRAAS